jgi:hypothetical protein
MRFVRAKAGWLGLLAGVVWVSAASRAAAQPAARAAPSAADRARAAATVPLDRLPLHVRDGARVTIEKPTVYSHGPAETFACDPAVYYWFLDHPDRAVAAWRRLGAKCVSISDRGNGRFGYADEAGSDLVWETVFRAPNLRIWYAEGKVKASPLLPLVPVKAVVLLRHAEGRGREGTPVIQHQTDMFLRTDSAAANLASKLMGASAPRMAEQCLGQLQMFFAGLAWYAHRHPDRAEAILGGAPAAAPRGVTKAGPSGN